MLEFQQNEQTVERRRWILVLVDASDGVTGKTGQTGPVKVSKNGGEPVDSSNGIVEVDSVEMPGHYYIELTAAELDSLGFISIYYKSDDTLAFHDRALITSNDPYAIPATGGGYASEGGPLVLTQKNVEMIAKAVWNHEIKERSAEVILEQAAQHPAIDLTTIQDKVDNIKIPELDLSPVLLAIKDLDIPQPINYKPALEAISDKLDQMDQAQVVGLREVLKDFNARMNLATEDINSSLDMVGEIKKGFETLSITIDKFNETVADATDMDRRFENMTTAMQTKDLQNLSATLQATMAQILTAIANTKYDVLEELEQLNKPQQ